ncbi:hypothetical protein DM02DRAFT_700347 [Periconia macrospinosa]|uniref:Galactose oxidase n=1 Tax=Periconia macrospinosa TaxID=97972 RepID=A0A2V1D3S5_9PLEO|nr:hypothetical protein DM02DRAFT_700347 [Periconia macrospinosa]
MKAVYFSIIRPLPAVEGFLTPRSNGKKTAAVLLWLVSHLAGAIQNPRDNFCRRYAHQTTVIDDKLYIDGGYVNFDSFPTDHLDVPSNSGSDAGWPQLNINLNKNPQVVPTVAGGILWGDEVNKKFVVYGGEVTQGLAQNYHLFSYDILYNSWSDLGPPTTPIPPNISSYGAGVSVSQLGQGYYYGGWISNITMRGWTQPPTMSSSMYRYDYDANKLTAMNSPDGLGRAEGGMSWIPAGDNGLLVYLGGIVDRGDGTKFPQPMGKILVYDPQTNSWFTQTATGAIPQERARFCMDAAWAPDRSSYNIYMWGGLNVGSNVNVTAFNDVYLLTLPTFQWVKIFPGHQGNATYDFGHHSASCNMVMSGSQMMVIGGTYPNSDKCDLAPSIWAQHTLWTGGVNNTGAPPDDIYWAQYSPNASSNVVPIDVYRLVGGDKNGGATLRTPKNGYDTGNNTGTGLAALLARKPNFQNRTATRSIPCTQSCPSPTGSTTPTGSPPSSRHLSTGAIVGIAVGGAAGLAFLLCAWWLLAKRHHQRQRQPHRQSDMTQIAAHPSSYNGAMSPTVSPQSPQGTWSSGPSQCYYPYLQAHSPVQLPPSEIGAQDHPVVISELEEQTSKGGYMKG